MSLTLCKCLYPQSIQTSPSENSLCPRPRTQ